MTIILILAALTLLLGIIEIFIAPGFGLAGIGAVACALADVVLVYYTYGPTWAIVTVVVALLLLAFALWWVGHSKTMNRMALHTSIDSTNATQAQLSVKVGDTGKALTRLALVGNAEINGNVVEVKSSGAFIQPETPIRVVNVSQALITVEAEKA